MTNAELIAKIKAEIERLKRQLIRGACAAQIEMETNCKDEAYDEILSFLSTLESEKPNQDELEEETDLYLEENYDYNSEYDTLTPNDGFFFSPRHFRNLARHFAQWGAEHASGSSEIPNDLEEVLPGFENEQPGIPGKDFVPVEWVETLEMYGKWKIVKLEEDGSSEIPNDLEEAADNHIRKVVDAAGHPGWDWTTQDISDAFIAGAKWQAEKCDEETSKLLYAERQTAYIHGWDDHKEQMMKEAVEGEIVESDGKCDKYFRYDHSAFVNAWLKYNIGDKVRIIIVKED